MCGGGLSLFKLGFLSSNASCSLAMDVFTYDDIDNKDNDSEDDITDGDEFDWDEGLSLLDISFAFGIKEE